MSADALSVIVWAASSFVEGLASMIVIWRFTGSRRLSDGSERTAQRLVAGSFLLLVPFFVYEAIRSLANGSDASSSALGIAITASAIVLMPLLGAAKLRLGERLGSAATAGEGVQNLMCAAQAAAALIALIGASAGLTVIDPIAALVVAAIAVKESVDLWRGAGRLLRADRLCRARARRLLRARRRRLIAGDRCGRGRPTDLLWARAERAESARGSSHRTTQPCVARDIRWVMVMREVSRRRFLQLAGGSVAATMLSDSIARAARDPGEPRDAARIEDVEHIVVLMQENRSFDHYFGVMRGVRGFGDPHPVDAAERQAGLVPGRRRRRRCCRSGPTSATSALTFIEDLDHSWDGTHQMFNGGDWDQWLPAKTHDLHGAHEACGPRRSTTRWPTPSRCATPTTARCSARPTPTATTCGPAGTATTARAAARSSPTTSSATAGRPTRSGCRRPGSAGRSTRTPASGSTRPATGAGRPIRTSATTATTRCCTSTTTRTPRPGSPLYQSARAPGTDVNDARRRSSTSCAADVKHGRLPQVSWIVAPEAYTEHPAWPAGYGAWYTAGVLDALTSNPEVWSKTALLITFDENDGFFDHVVGAVPQRRRPRRRVDRAAGQRAVRRHGRDAGGSDGVAGPYGLGVRVPLLVVSPWSTGGYVCSETFDHTSLIRFIEARFGVDEPNITPWRRAVCGDLTSAFDFAERVRSRAAAAQRRRLQADRTPTPPTTTRRRRPMDRSPAGAGRPAVARLGYRFDVDFDAGPRKLKLAVSNRGRLGVAPAGPVADRGRRARTATRSGPATG